MTALVNAGAARTRVDRIKIAVEGAWQLIVESYQARDWDALGYATWDEMCTREFGTSRLRLPREERQEVVSSLREQGLSLRAISAATGYSEPTVRRTLAPASNDAPEPRVIVDRSTGEVLDDEEPDPWAEGSPQAQEFLEPPAPKITGIDGKQYAPTQMRVERRSDLTDSARRLAMDLYRLTNRVQKLGQDDRLGRNTEQVAALMRSHLSDAVEVCQDLLDRLSSKSGV